MSNQRSFVDARVEIRPGEAAARRENDPERPFRVALIGDFSGRRNANRRWLGPGLLGCRPQPIDKDDFDEVLGRLGPSLRTPSGELRFADMDDFHPESLYQRAPLFQALRRLRKRLNDRAEFPAAARELAAGPERTAAPPLETSPRSAWADGGEILTEMLGGGGAVEAQPEVRPAPSGDEEWNAFIRDLVAPHLVAGRDPRQEELVARVDASIGASLRTLLHDPDFQELEANWRALFRLIRRLEVGVDLKISLIDLSKEELRADLLEAARGEDAGLYRLLVDEASDAPGVGAWSAVAALHRFEPTVAEIEALGRLASIAQRSGSAFIAEAAPAFIGVESFEGETVGRGRRAALDPEAESAWRSLRARPESAWVGLALPRLLLRTPYDPDSTDAFEFDESAEGLAHDRLLWGSPAAACVELLGEAFTRQGWTLRPGSVREIDGLPVHNFRRDDRVEMTPCAEAWLTEEAAERILEAGFMPWISIRGRDAAALPRFQSIAAPLAPLRGPWSA